MTIATIEHRQTAPADPAVGDQLEALKQLHAGLLRSVSSIRSKRELLAALAELVPRYAKPAAMFYFERNPQGQLADGICLHPAEDDDRTDRLRQQLSSACQTACRQGALEVRRQGVPARLIVAAPVMLQGRDPEAVGFIFPLDSSGQSAIMLVQLVASHLVLWHVLAMGRASEQDARTSTALVELLGKMGAAPDLRAACFILAGELQAHLQCVRVAVGLRPVGKGHCRLTAISGVAQFDLRSPTACAMEAAMDEAVLQDDLTVWPPLEEHPRHGALALKNLCSLEDVAVVACMPLHSHEGQAIGALLLLDDSSEKVARSQRFLRASERSIAQTLDIAMRLEGGWLVRIVRQGGRHLQKWKGRIALSVIVLAAAAMAIPLPYRLHCDCQIEPVIRRFIAAPFEGVLEKALVKPGDLVEEGDLLASLDGREIRWKRAGLLADQSQAAKKRDSAQAAHNYAEMQIAALEFERLTLELQLLDHRAGNLEVRSPVRGIVVAGDLERAEGAPLTLGQTLFEIAPLERMVVEVAVPDADVSFVRVGQPIDVRLDAYPGDAWRATLAKVHPRSEIRDEQNVFVAEMDLDNPEGRLSPGMKGRATVETDSRPLGWILFHKPWEYAIKKLSW